MTGRPLHRGPHPKDQALFGQANYAYLGDAVIDYFYLVSKDYGERGALKLVGDRYRLRKRQRFALQKIVCSRSEVFRIMNRRCLKEDMPGRAVHVDGLNVLILLEALLSGAFVFECVDSSFRDISGVHGHYRRVQETIVAMDLISRIFKELRTGPVRWYLDAPVSNSGKLGKMLSLYAADHNLQWEVRVVDNPDMPLRKSANEVVISSDRTVTAQCNKWFNLAGYCIACHKPDNARVITLADLGLDLASFSR